MAVISSGISPHSKLTQHARLQEYWTQIRENNLMLKEEIEGKRSCLSFQCFIFYIYEFICINSYKSSCALFLKV